MKEEERNILQRIYPALLKDLEPNEVLPHIIAAGYITHENYEEEKSKVKGQIVL